MGVYMDDSEGRIKTPTTSSTNTKRTTRGISGGKKAPSLEEKAASVLYKILMDMHRIKTFNSRISDELIYDADGRDVFMEEVERRIHEAFADHLKSEMAIKWVKTTNDLNHKYLEASGEAIVLAKEDLTVLIGQVIDILWTFDEFREMVYNKSKGTDMTGPR